ncbi:MAG: hypothetical protein U0790_15245 [Isosphaeraceae bacterium]
MLWRHLCLVRAWLAAGLTGGLMLIGADQAPAQTPAAADPESAVPPAAVVTETVDVLKASKSGELTVVARGQGQDRVRLSIRNATAKRLQVVLPPGLVASSAAGQRGGGGGLQNMGLGSFSNRPGSFGEFRMASGAPGLRSVPTIAADPTPALTVPSGETIDVTVPAVCLNYGLPSPTPKDTFTLMDVADYSDDPRVRKSLRSLCLLGTSQAVAQAVMWRVCNDLPFETMIAEAGRVMNEQEVALAARFVGALDASEGSDMVDPNPLAEGLVYARVVGEGALAKDARRLNDQLENHRLLGLPLRVAEGADLPASSSPAIFVNVVVTDSQVGETRGRLTVSYCTAAGQWIPLGKASFQETSSIAVLDGDALATAVDRALASAFVSVKPARRSVGSTTLRLENRLPFTLSGVIVKAGNSAGAPTVPFEAVGVGPGRSALLPIQAATATIERVQVNGL